MSNIEKIRQEIERRLKYTHDWLRGDEKRHPKQTAISKNYYKMKGDERTLDALLAFIDSLPEEKPSEDLEEAAAKYELENRQSILSSVDIVDAFIAGAEWQKKQMELDGSVTLTESDFDAEKEKASEWGYNLCKEQMMNGAVDGEIVKDITNMLAVTAKNINLDGFKFGDKVKIIIVKQDE